MAMTNPIFKARGGGWYGMMLQGSWPFGKLEVYDDRIEFSVASATKVLEWNEVDYSRRLFIIPFMADGILIVPKDRKPQLLIFWALTNTGKILSLLESKGVNTKAKYTKDILPLVILAYLPIPIIILFLLTGFGLMGWAGF